MPNLNVEIANPGHLFEDAASLFLSYGNASAAVSKLARVMDRQGEPTVALMLRRIAELMAKADADNKTIALSKDHFALAAFVDYDDAHKLAAKDY